MCLTALRCVMFLEPVVPLQPREKEDYKPFSDNMIREQYGMLRKKKHPLIHEVLASHKCCLSYKRKKIGCFPGSKKQIPQLCNFFFSRRQYWVFNFYKILFILQRNFQSPFPPKTFHLHNVSL